MVKILETSLRDGQQSLIATRMKTSEMLPILEKMDKAGYYAMEVWGGATFDSCIRFLDEDPWERLREIRKRVKNTKLQMLLRGQNLLGYRNYSDDVVEKFVQKSIENGIDIIRIFDALNDTRNLKTATMATKKYGGHAQLTIAYTVSPVHTIEYYTKLALEMQEMGADSIAIKDMSGILLPERGYELITKLKAELDIPIELHSHQTSGIASMLYVRAVDAGIDIIDTGISPFGGGTAQPPTESVARALMGTPADPKLDMALLKEIADYFKPIRQKYLDEGILSPKALFVQPDILEYQVPGGMLSNLLSQLKKQKAESKYYDVLKEIPNVRKDLGYPPLVTPMSQMVGTQAVINVLTNGRYKMIPKEIKDYVKGLYGKSPAPISDEMRHLIIGNAEVYTGRPADLLPPEWDKLKSEISDVAHSDEDVLIYAMFPQVAREFLSKKNKDYKKDDLSGETIGQIVERDVKETVRQNKNTEIITNLPGEILSIDVKVGDKVKEGETLLYFDAMCLENPLNSPVAGTVTDILVKKGDIVKPDTPLMIISK